MPPENDPAAMSDEYAGVPVAADTAAATWEARYCQTRDENVKLHEQAARHLRAIAVAARALERYGKQANGGEQARVALEIIQSLSKGAPDAR